jgi:hypothetical protein
MARIGRLLQIGGLLLTGYAAAAGFFADVSEGFFIAAGFGGFALFLLGGLCSGRRS